MDHPRGWLLCIRVWPLSLLRPAPVQEAPDQGPCSFCSVPAWRCTLSLAQQVPLLLPGGRSQLPPSPSSKSCFKLPHIIILVSARNFQGQGGGLVPVGAFAHCTPLSILPWYPQHRTLDSWARGWLPSHPTRGSWQHSTEWGRGDLGFQTEMENKIPTHPRTPQNPGIPSERGKRRSWRSGAGKKGREQNGGRGKGEEGTAKPALWSMARTGPPCLNWPEVTPAQDILSWCQTPTPIPMAARSGLACPPLLLARGQLGKGLGAVVTREVKADEKNVGPVSPHHGGISSPW